MELPECPVCLQTYDGDCTIPRVLACGHSVCETCLQNLPRQFPETIRCPACTVLVKYPPQGASALPKNIELLRLCSHLNADCRISQKPEKQPLNHSYEFFPQLWSDEFYKTWADWVLPQGSVSIEGDDGVQKLVLGRIGSVSDSGSSLPIWVKENQRVSLVRVAVLPCSSSDSVLKFGYVATVMKCLSGLKDEERKELGLILGVGIMSSGRVCKTYGLWGNSEDGFLYLVCKRQNGNLVEKINGWINKLELGNKARLNNDEMRSFSMIAIEICEAIMALHSLRLSTGFLGLSCFGIGEFGGICIDVNDILVMGRTICEMVMETSCTRSKIDTKELGILTSNLIKREVFVSPEVLLKLLQEEGIMLQCGTTISRIEYMCDVWSLAFVLLSLLLGKGCLEEILGALEERYSDCSALYESWVEKVSTCLDVKLCSEYVSLRQTFCKSLNFNPENRPCVTELWRCIRELIISSELDTVDSLKLTVNESGTDHCLVLGDLVQLPKKLVKTQRDDTDQIGEEKIAKNIIDGLFEGMVKSNDMLGHRDCITGLAVGGDFLFSTSYDKTIRAWSLQDFAHAHTFIGHEHRVMDLVYIDEEQPLCVSADIGGGIYVWSITIPLKQGPLKKWYEEKDWRYSGIHALAYSENGYLYTGGGDKSIKVWLLKDSILSCTMDGHKSVVSALVACNGVLYSGSYDGTVRLWSLTDHSLLTVLGEESSGLSSILCLAADRQMLVATHENGSIKVWRNDVYMKTIKSHNASIFATSMQGKWLFTGGLDKTVNVQELSGDEFQIDCRHLGSIPSTSTVTALFCWQGKLFVGYADRAVKVYHYGS